MGILTGRESKIEIGDVKVLDMADFTLSIDAPILTSRIWGTTTEQITGFGRTTSIGTVSGLISSDDAGQQILEDAVTSGTKLIDFKLYVGNTMYWTSDLITESDAGVFISGLNIKSVSKEINKVDFNFKFSGAIYKVEQNFVMDEDNNIITDEDGEGIW